MSAIQVGQQARPAGIPPQHPQHNPVVTAGRAAPAQGRFAAVAVPMASPVSTGEPIVYAGDAAHKDKVIVSCAFGGTHYLQRQHKFLHYVQKEASQYPRVVFNCLPNGCPQHSTTTHGAYAFKIHAIQNAIDRGYRYVLWLDTTMIVVKPLQPLWDCIAEHGWYVCPQAGARLGEYTSDEALAIYGIDRELAMHIQLPYSGIVGLDMKGIGGDIWREWKKLCEAGAFMGHHHAPGRGSAGGGKTVGKVSEDPRVSGHRHDESAIGYVLYKLGLTYWYAEGDRWYFPNRGLFAHETPDTGLIAHINTMRI